ncbi:MAG: substrate-binding domain-containing protein [Actinobacteria bacterium]|nr:substrate-binding domain-containing protein [Actinomycetota bacterium]MCL6088463.1 substrate-binding domain-containing protein [Actinomycetota bacterium]
MKKGLIWLVVVMVVATMTLIGIGCKTTAVETTAAETTAAETTAAETTAAETTAAGESELAGKKRIVYVTPCFNFSPDWNVAHKWFMDKCQENGYIGTVVGPNEINTEIMIEDMEIAIADKVDAIANCPLVPDQFKATYEKAKAAKIPVVDVAIDSGFDAAISFVGTNYDEVGKMAADKIYEKVGKGANILVVYTGPESANQENELNAFIKYADEKYPGAFKIVDKVFDKSQIELAAELGKASLTAHPEINVVWCIEGAAPQGISTAVQELNLVGKVNILGIDMQPKTVEDMAAGIIWASFEQNFPGWGGTPVDLLTDYWAGKEVPRVVDSGVTFWSNDKLDEYYATHK